jgi:lipopolysaccharide/colanic/teichoic acid biosynthesis glycosyltransferase
MKRLFDMMIASIALVAMMPAMVMLAFLVRINMGAPILFCQARPGLHGRPFKMLKFRTMRDAYDRDGVPLADADRITRFGRWLRSTSLDELPSLWSVLKGDMSLVGPRPLLMEYLPLYSPDQARRHEVRPGITGWAQVNGRNALSWEEKFVLDLWYVDHRSFVVDLKILMLTVRKVFLRDGINAAGNPTMPKFLGNESSP